MRQISIHEAQSLMSEEGEFETCNNDGLIEDSFPRKIAGFFPTHPGMVASWGIDWFLSEICLNA